MKKILLTFLVTATAALTHADSFNQTITAIFGGGNSNLGWVTDTANDITLGLRAKNRDDNTTTNVAGVYSFATGFNVTNNRARWNYEFSIDSGSAFLSAYDYYLGIDTDGSQGINYAYVNPFAVYNDNSFGTSATLNGQGFEGPTAGNSLLANSYYIAQNSQNIVFLSFNPLLNSTYNYELFAVASGAGVNGTRLVDANITVIVGSGGAAVPDSTTSALLIGASLLSLGLLRRKLV